MKDHLKKKDKEPQFEFEKTLQLNLTGPQPVCMQIYEIQREGKMLSSETDCLVLTKDAMEQKG